MIVARIGHAADDGDGDLLDADGAVQRVHGADQAGGVAGGELQIVLAQALLIVGIAMEENVRDAVLLAALEDGLHAVLVVVVGLVLGADAAGSGVQHDVNGLAQLLEGAGHRDVQRVKLALVRAVHQVQVVLHVVRADHVALAQCADGKGGGQIGDADQLHVALQGHAVRQTLTDSAVTGDANTNFLAHWNLLLQIRSLGGDFLGWVLNGKWGMGNGE